MTSNHADLPPHLLSAVVALIEALSFSVVTGDKACLWLSSRDLVNGAEGGRQVLHTLHEISLIDRRSLSAATGKRAKWVCRLKQSELESIRLGFLLPQLDAAHRRSIPPASVVRALYYQGK